MVQGLVIDNGRISPLKTMFQNINNTADHAAFINGSFLFDCNATTAG